MNTSHLNALQVRLSHEKGYFAAAKTEGEKELRAVWIAQIEKEIVAEKAFIGYVDSADVEMTEDDLLRELEL